MLDEASWKTLRQKATMHFNDHRQGQIKQGFFNQLNEAFAYQLLHRLGHQDIRFVDELPHHETPDLSYRANGTLRHCEVKSIGISEDEIERRTGAQAWKRPYASLNVEFFNQLDCNIGRAEAQIASAGTCGLVFIIVTFDDFTGTYYSTYRRQIEQHLQRHEAKDVFVKVGITEQRRISKSTPSGVDRQ